MKKYTLNYRDHMGNYRYYNFKATCNTDARFIARDFYRNNFGVCALAIFTFNGEYVEL